MSATVPTPPAVEFRDVFKSFSRHKSHVLLRNYLMNWFKEGNKSRFPVLKGISFRLDRGESLAVVGANGAGKSTLLSLVAGLSTPDSGTVAVNGRLAALLELGSGFHPDLTGAENIFMNASLLGFSRSRTREIFPRIVEFSELAEFLDEPLRTYSSGMIMRLAFSVAVNIDPDILITDEVLAVGDHSFQLKCYEKIWEFRNAGKTMLFVSHAPPILKQLCTRAIWIDHGQIVMDGAIDDVLNAYHGSVNVAT